MASDPREIHKAKQAVEDRFRGEPVERLALAAAVNTELLLDEIERHRQRIASLERDRLILYGGLIVLALMALPLFLFAVTGRI